MKTHIITIGDEILIGQIVDTNSAWMGQMLNQNGIEIVEITSISDQYHAIVQTLDRVLNVADIVLITGGLGPTKDDITKKALADYFGLEMAYHEESFLNMRSLFEKFNRTITEEYKAQCFMPVGATILRNLVGTAPGMWFEYKGKIIVSMPGVPWEMQYLMEKEVIPKLLHHFPSSPIEHATILTAGIGETDLSNKIEQFENSLANTGVKLAYLPYLGGVRLRLTARGNDALTVKEVLHKKANELTELVRSYIIGFEKDTIETVLHHWFIERGLTLGLAESCTGGYIAHRLTSLSGSSVYFKGGVVVYSNELKRNLLDVPESVLDTHGAVSEATVKAMVEGTLRRLKVDYAVAVSGIAGPNGGKPDKPVGTVWVAVGNHTTIKTKEFKFGRDRAKNIELAGFSALVMLKKFIAQ